MHKHQSYVSSDVSENPCSLRDDAHMTSMKVFQFLRPPLPMSIHVQNSSTPLTSTAQFQTNPPSPNDSQSIKRKHNPNPG